MAAVELGPIDGIAILGGGTAFPSRELQNAEVLRGLPAPPRSDEQLQFLAAGARETLGLERRRWAHPVGAPLDHASEETTLDLALRASRAALHDSGVAAGELSLILCATSTPHRMTSTVAAPLGSALGAAAACMDTRTGCSGGLFALTTAALYLGAGSGPALIVGAETFSKIIPPQHRGAQLALGDGAAALVIGKRKGAQLVSAFLETDGALGRLITTDGALPPTESEIARGGYQLSGAPEELSQVVPQKYAAAIGAALKRAGSATIDLFVPHQTSRELIAKVAAGSKIPLARTFINVERHANIGAAGWMAALVEAREEGRCPSGTRLLLASVGGGGAAVLIDLRESDAPALVTAEGEEFSYRALAEAVRAEAGALREQGAGPGKLVALALPKAKQFVVSALAVWECGAALLPLDVRAGLQPVQALLGRARPFLLRTADAIEQIPQARELDARVALLLFTSGSSGPPKGVLLSRDGLRANVEAILRYLPAARAAIVLPLTYSYALVGQLLTALHAGATALLLGELKYPAEQLAAMVRLQATGLSSVPSSLRLLARAVMEGSDAPGLRYLASAGAPLDAATIALLGSAFPGARIWNQYGLTEASPRVAAISDDDPAFEEGSAGRPLQGVEVRTEREEILVRGPSVMLGYLDDPEATTRALAGGWLHTGDLGRVDPSGRLFVHGRGDGVVKCAGERVGLDEVASVLRECPGVADACVVALPDEALGARLIAFIESTPEVVPAARRTLREKLLPAKRPGQIIALDALPRMPSGKIDRQALQRRAETA